MRNQDYTTALCLDCAQLIVAPASSAASMPTRCEDCVRRYANQLLLLREFLASAR